MTVKLQKIRIGTRGSPLALRQTEMVRSALAAVVPEIETEVVVIKTSGDWKPDDGEVRLNADAGGKGQFAKEIEAALLAGDIDCAVHSMKDMETVLPEGLVIPCMLPREDVRDALLLSEELREKYSRHCEERGDEAIQSQEHKSLDSFADARNDVWDIFSKGAIIGTASVRRQAFLLNKRPDLKCVPLRGNVETRIEKVRCGKIEDGKIDATFLAIAGLNRLNLAHEADLVLDIDDMLPAAGQGAVGIEMRAHSEDILAVFGQLNCITTLLCVKAERAALSVLDGSCHTPIGAYATLKEGHMHLRLSVAALDGSALHHDEAYAPVKTIENAEELGVALARKLKANIPPGLLSQVA